MLDDFHDVRGSSLGLRPGKVVCVGRNYAAHARELNNPVPAEPLLFIKPNTALAYMQLPLVLPLDRGEVHHELEIALLIGRPLLVAEAGNLRDADAWAAVTGIGLALDLTLRDLQARLKEKGQPWEKAKAFDGSCPVSGFVAAPGLEQVDSLRMSLRVNGELRQQGCSADMLFAIPRLLGEIVRHFSLLPGDLVLTGTPAGVGPLHCGDRLQLSLDGYFSIVTEVQ